MGRKDFQAIAVFVAMAIPAALNCGPARATPNTYAECQAEWQELRQQRGRLDGDYQSHYNYCELGHGASEPGCWRRWDFSGARKGLEQIQQKIDQLDRYCSQLKQQEDAARNEERRKQDETRRQQEESRRQQESARQSAAVSSTTRSSGSTVDSSRTRSQPSSYPTPSPSYSNPNAALAGAAVSGAVALFGLVRGLVSLASSPKEATPSPPPPKQITIQVPSAPPKEDDNYDRLLALAQAANSKEPKEITYAQRIALAKDPLETAMRLGAREMDKQLLDAGLEASLPMGEPKHDGYYDLIAGGTSLADSIALRSNPFAKEISKLALHGVETIHRQALGEFDRATRDIANFEQEDLRASANQSAANQFRPSPPSRFSRDDSRPAGASGNVAAPATTAPAAATEQQRPEVATANSVSNGSAASDTDNGWTPAATWERFKGWVAVGDAGNTSTSGAPQAPRTDVTRGNTGASGSAASDTNSSWTPAATWERIKGWVAVRDTDSSATQQPRSDVAIANTVPSGSAARDTSSSSTTGSGRASGVSAGGGRVADGSRVYRDPHSGAVLSVPAGYTLYRDPRTRRVSVVSLADLDPSIMVSDRVEQDGWQCGKVGVGVIEPECERRRRAQVSRGSSVRSGGAP